MKRLWVGAILSVFLPALASSVWPGTGGAMCAAVFADTVADPSFSPEPGDYQTSQVVTITCATDGAEIRYTTDDSTPGPTSTLYTEPITVSVTTRIKAYATKTDWQDSAVVSGMFRIDNQGPVVLGLTTVPTKIRKSKDPTLTVIAAASDSSRGGGNIAGAEYFINDDPGVGNGIPVPATDGEFNGPSESLTATVDVSAWLEDLYQVNVRARDAAGNWGPVATRNVEVVEGVPPAQITDLRGMPAGSMRLYAVAIESFSSQAQGAPVSALVDGQSSTYWQTAGTVTPETEFVVLDMLSTKKINSFLLVPYIKGELFPSYFDIEISKDKTTWTNVARARGFRAAWPVYMWQFEPTDTRYIKIFGPGVYNRSDKHYAWRIASAAAGNLSEALVRLDWTAVADDGTLGEPASRYDIRYSTSGITEANFEAASQATGFGTPTAASLPDKANVNIGTTTGIVNLAMKAADENSNWSPMSNTAQVYAYITGFASTAPADGFEVAADAPPTFEFKIDPMAKPAVINFSSSPQFVTRPTLRPDGRYDKSVKAKLKVTATSWKPTVSQWKAIKAIVPPDGVLYWRLEGVIGAVYGTYGPRRSVQFKTGGIDALVANPGHSGGTDEALWPDVATPPTFQWTNNTTAMKYFWVEISTLDAVPLTDKKETIVLGGAGVTGNTYAATPADWKKIRYLATAGSGMLYWRVRAKDADKVLTCASTAKKLIMDGGEWTVGDLDLGAEAPQVLWSHVGDGIVRYSLMFSTESGFPAVAKRTIRMPSKSITGTSYSLSPAQVTRLRKLAAANSVTALYYRVRGEDAQRAFLTYSDTKTVTIP